MGKGLWKVIRYVLPGIEPSVRVLKEAAGTVDMRFVFDQGSTASAIILGDSREALRDFPDNVFQTCVSSPPYWSLRNYHKKEQIWHN